MDTLREWAESWIEVPDDWRFTRTSLSLSFGSGGPTLQFQRSQLRHWESRKLPVHPELTLVPHCGVETQGYAEYLVNLEHLGQWPREEPLPFRVGSTLVQLGAISPALSLILEPYYKAPYEYQHDFYEQYSSLKVFNSQTPRDDALAALFYLNSDYLRPSKAAASILHLLDPASVEDAPAFSTKRARRQRIRVRPQLESLLPIRLFLAAAPDYSDSRFLSFYRVLEFYFTRARSAELSAARRDLSVPDSTFFRRVRDERGELPQLQAVVRAALTPAETRALVRYATYHTLATVSAIDDVSAALYDHRNAIVHAKESEAARSRVPDPFCPTRDSHGWDWVVEYLAVRCIRRL